MDNPTGLVSMLTGGRCRRSSRESRSINVQTIPLLKNSREAVLQLSLLDSSCGMMYQSGILIGAVREDVSLSELVIRDRVKSWIHSLQIYQSDRVYLLVNFSIPRLQEYIDLEICEGVNTYDVSNTFGMPIYQIYNKHLTINTHEVRICSIPTFTQ